MGGEGAVGAVGPSAVDENEAVEKLKTDPWKRAESQPIRVDHIENAVKFLSHPKVRTSPIVHRRSFLEKKGLTGDEIDEAFRRMPDPPSSDMAGVPLSQPVALAQNLGAGRKLSGLSWGQKLLGLAAIATVGAGAGVVTKAYLFPKLRSWVCSILAEEGELDEKMSLAPSPSPAPVVEPPPLLSSINDAAVAATAAAAAAAEVAAAMREFSQSRSKESLQLGSIIKSLETQTQELKSAVSGMRDVVSNAESTTSATLGEGHRQDPWRTPEMQRPSSVVYSGAANAVSPSERTELAENETQLEHTDSL